MLSKPAAWFSMVVADLAARIIPMVLSLQIIHCQSRPKLAGVPRTVRRVKNVKKRLHPPEGFVDYPYAKRLASTVRDGGLGVSPKVSSAKAGGGTARSALIGARAACFNSLRRRYLPRDI